MLKMFLNAMVQEFLTAKIGKPVLDGHGVVTAVGDHSVTAKITVNTGYVYNITIERVI